MGKLFNGLESFSNAEPITKGWSEDKKYRVTTTDGETYLLRISPISRFETRKSLFAILERVSALDIPMCKPIEFGVCDDGVYSIQSWIDGEDLEVVLPTLTEAEQYMLGLKSGEIARKMHSIPAPETNANNVGAEEWSVRFGRKTDIKIQKYRECGLRFDGDEHVIAYIAQNRDLLENRPQCFQHGDYHVGNMMLENGEKPLTQRLKIIDFDRYDFGDPWEEFNRIVWSAAASPHFATGQMKGYFGGEPPMEFWRLLAFYIASNTLSSIYWAIPFGQSDVNIMMQQSQDVLRWYDNMQNPVPTWYLRGYELWDVYDENRNKTGQTIPRGTVQILADGEFHLAAFMYILRSDGKFLITKRSPQKKTFPNMWEIPHGAVLSGETSLDAAIREAFEECGLVLERENAIFAAEYRGGNLISDKWLFHQDFDLADIVLQEGETCDARACTLDDIFELVKNSEIQEYIYHEVKAIKEKWGSV